MLRAAWVTFCGLSTDPEPDARVNGQVSRGHGHARQQWREAGASPTPPTCGQTRST